MDNIRHLMRLRPDFALEVGWFDLVSEVVSESDWNARKLAPSIAEIYGPGREAKSYEDYCDCMRRLKPSRLMLYFLWIPVGKAVARAHVRSQRIWADVEHGQMPHRNLLFHEMLEKAEAAMELPESERSPLRPIPYRYMDRESIAPSCLVHDTETGDLWVASYRVGYDLVTRQRGGGVQETLALLGQV